MSLFNWRKNNNEAVAEPDYDDKTSFLEVKSSSQEPNPIIGNRSVCTICSDTKKSLNQDCACQAFVEKTQAHVLAVADGVGSSYKAEVGSRFVCEKAVELVVDSLENGVIDIDFKVLFQAIQEGLDSLIESQYASELPDLKEGSFASTLIVGIDFSDRFVVAYVGNGSILHIGGNFVKFPAYMCLPWNAVNLLNPHTIEVQGKESLYKFFYYKGESFRHTPSVIEVKKNMDDPGDIFVITTDGVYSSDHELTVKDEEGELWMPLPKQLGMLHEALKQFASAYDELSESRLNQTFVSYLTSLKDGNVMDDDTTLGVVFSCQAIDYLKKQNIRQ